MPLFISRLRLVAVALGFCRLGLVALLLVGMLLQGGGAVLAAESSASASAAPAAEPDALQSLVKLLEDPDTRQQLIGQLKQITASEAAEGMAAVTPSASVLPVDLSSLPSRLADHAQRFLQAVSSDAKTAAALMDDLSSVSAQEKWWDAWLEPVSAVSIVIVVTLVAYWLFRWVARRGYRLLDQAVASQRQQFESQRVVWLNEGRTQPIAGSRPWLALQWRRLLAIGGGVLLDLGCVLAAAAAGYGVTLLAGTYFGQVSIFEPLFINAFIVTEVTKALARGVFATRFPDLRLFRMADAVASYWYRWLAVLITLVGYGTLLLVPMLQRMFTPAVGHLMGLLLMIGVYFYAARVILQHRLVLRDRLLGRATQVQSSLFGTLLRMLARCWHLLALGYFTVLLVVSQVAPERALPFMAGATLQTAMALGGALLASILLTALLSHRIRLSDEWRARLPLLESRLNSYVPAVLHALRLTIMVMAILVVLDAWRLLRLAEWFASEPGQALLSMIIRVAIILALAAMAWVLLASVVEHRISALPGADGASARERTLLSLFRNAALIVIVTLTGLVVLSQIGIDIGPLIAGAGVVGLAIGFGAQKLVQDVITGIFIQVENGMNQNDVVEVAGVFGTVEKITIRSVSLRTLDGCFHIIPFSSIDKVSNHMRGFSYHLGHYTISYRESVDEAMHHLKAAFTELMQDEVLAPEILEEITIPGVTTLDDRGVTIRVMIKTAPGMQWAVQRGYNRLVKKHFSDAGIELSYPHRVVYFGQDRNGEAPPVRVRDVAAPGSPADTVEAQAGGEDGIAPMPQEVTRSVAAAQMASGKMAAVTTAAGQVISPTAEASEPTGDAEPAAEPPVNRPT